LATVMFESGAVAADAMDFASIVRLRQSMVFSIAYHYLHDRALAEEVAQEVFLQLFERLQGFDSPEHVTFWLRRAACHRSIDCARRRKLRPQVGLDDAPEPAVPPAPGDPLLSRALNRLVGSLPEKPRMVVILRYQEDMDPSEIAETLGMPLRTVKSHLQRSLAMLREKLVRTVGQENL